MSSVGLDVFLILLLILMNGALSMAEIAIVSSRKARLQRLAEEGDRKARIALDLANEPAPLLSTVQIGITLVGILAGVFGGTTVAEHLGSWLNRFAWLGGWNETVAVGLVVVVITYLSVVIGELVPKRLALNGPERIASRVAGPMNLLARIAFPAVRVLSASTNLVLRVLGSSASDEPLVTEEEIRVLIRQATTVGVFEEAEQSMVERVFRFGDRRVSALMTPRTEVVWADLDDPIEENLRKMVESGHSYFPVCRGHRDHIIGVASVKKLWACSIEDRSIDLKSCLLKPLFVPESVPALKLLELFKQAGSHIALVIDEYGGFQGMVTLNDVLGAIVGDVTWSHFDDEPQIIEREDGSWLIDGMLPVDELQERFRLRSLAAEEEGGYQTVGGFVMAQIGRIPRSGDSFERDGLRFEVVDMDEMRVDKVLVSCLPEAGSEDGGLSG
jgi:putative hemolysin